MYPLMLELVETGLLAYEVSVILYSEPFTDQCLPFCQYYIWPTRTVSRFPAKIISQGITLIMKVVCCTRILASVKYSLLEMSFFP